MIGYTRFSVHFFFSAGFFPRRRGEPIGFGFEGERGGGEKEREKERGKRGGAKNKMTKSIRKLSRRTSSIYTFFISLTRAQYILLTFQRV